MITRFLKASAERAFGLILVLLSVITVALVAVQTIRLGDVTECQATYNETYAKAIKSRSEAARSERQAQRTLWVTVLDPAVPVDDKRAAFGVYLKALDAADDVRDKADLPTRRC